MSHSDTNAVDVSDAYERSHAPQWDDRAGPTRGEADEDARLDAIDRRQSEAIDRARRARGEYVPSHVTEAAGTMVALTLVQRGMFGCRVVPVREGVFRIDGLTDLDDPLFKGDTFDPAKYEFRVVDQTVWLKREPADPGPPF